MAVISAAVGADPKEQNGVALSVNSRVWNTVLGSNLKITEWSLSISKANLFNITVIQVYALTTNAEEAEIEWLYEDLQDLELTPKEYVLFIIGDWNAKVGSQEIPRIKASLALECKMKQGKG